MEGIYDVLAQYDNPKDNYLQTFCNATGEKTYILDKIMAGVRAIYGTICNDIYDMSFNKDFGWDWQVYILIYFVRYISNTTLIYYVAWNTLKVFKPSCDTLLRLPLTFY